MLICKFPAVIIVCDDFGFHLYDENASVRKFIKWLFYYDDEVMMTFSVVICHTYFFIYPPRSFVVSVRVCALMLPVNTGYEPLQKCFCMHRTKNFNVKIIIIILQCLHIMIVASSIHMKYSTNIFIHEYLLEITNFLFSFHY